MQKISRRYTPYVNKKWQTLVLLQMKEETGFDPQDLIDGEDVTTMEFMKKFTKYTPQGKVIQCDGDTHNLRVVVDEFVPEKRKVMRKKKMEGKNVGESQ